MLPFPLGKANVFYFLVVSSEIYLSNHGVLLLVLDLSILDMIN